MRNPFGSQNDPRWGAYGELKRRILERLQEAKVSDQIFTVVQEAYEDALKWQNIVLSRAEKERLLSQILKSVLEDMIRKLDDRRGK
jgi:hypothetical protein